MQETEQRTIFGEEINEQVNIQTTGRTIRPVKRMVGQFADEYKINFDSDGMHINVVDVANVAMITLTISESVFSTYEVDGEVTIGVNHDSFGSVLQHARYGKSTDDQISLRADSRHLETEVSRELGDTSATFTERTALIDTNGIREEPENPDLEFETKATLDPQAFVEVINVCEGMSEINLAANSKGVVVSQDMDVDGRTIQLENEISGSNEGSSYDSRYIKNVAKALKTGYVDSLTLEWNEEYPLVASFERDDWLDGSMMIAPRIRS